MNVVSGNYKVDGRFSGKWLKVFGGNYSDAREKVILDFLILPSKIKK